VFSFPLRQPGFSFRSVNVKFVVGEVPLDQVSLRALRFLLPILTPPNFPFSLIHKPMPEKGLFIDLSTKGLSPTSR
jgi:hypothetical protein